MTEVVGPPRWRGGNFGPFLIAAVVVAMVVGTRWTGTLIGKPPTSTTVGEQPSAGTSATPGPLPGATSTTPIHPVVTRTEPIDALGPTTSVSFPLGDLLSVSPDGRLALVWTQLAPANQVELNAVPLMGGDPIRLGIAGYEPRGPDDAVDRLALPAWSADSRSVAFENGARGTIASLVGDAPIQFTALSDTPLTALSEGGFVFNTPSGPRVAGRADVPSLAGAAGLSDVVYFPDGRAAVGADEAGNLVWTDGRVRDVVARQPDYAFPLAWRLVSRSSQALVLVSEILPIRTAYVVGSNGMVTTLELGDPCGAPSVSDAGAFAAFHTCDRSVEAAGSAAYYSLRIMRLSDGASVGIGPGAVEPVFLPGTHRLVWLGLSGNPPVQPTYTLSIASNEVLP